MPYVPSFVGALSFSSTEKPYLCAKRIVCIFLKERRHLIEPVLLYRRVRIRPYRRSFLDEPDYTLVKQTITPFIRNTIVVVAC